MEADPDKNPGAGDADAAAGDSLSSSSSAPAQNKQKTPLDPEEEEFRQLEMLALRCAMSEEDGSLEDLSSLLNKYYPNGCPDDPEDKWFYTSNFCCVCVFSSQGFDIDGIPTTYLTRIPVVPVFTVTDTIIDLAKLSINHYNQKNDCKIYDSVKVEKANARAWGSGANFYITFQASVPENSDASAHALTSFQALVWSGSGNRTSVKSCRPKAVGS
ncbi:hypothetical protein ACH5RR_018087 [Cinchona calisaya]|uniref:Uncharacterized protein n=1 Tax=Cinchona calisaya TaxID=153742 RepID=A0ABD2ZLR6_9GENT